MKEPLPFNARPIYVPWRKNEFGIGVTARTDGAALPYVGLYPLDWDGKPMGSPIYFFRQRLMADIVVGQLWHKPVVLFVDAEVMGRGLAVRLRLPLSLAGHGGNIRHLSAKWGDPEPRFWIFS